LGSYEPRRLVGLSRASVSAGAALEISAAGVSSASGAELIPKKLVSVSHDDLRLGVFSAARDGGGGVGAAAGAASGGAGRAGVAAAVS
jgi:hypothetical protein